MKRHLLTSNIPSQALICLWRFAIFLLSLISTVTRVKKATTTKNNKNQAQPNWTPARHTEWIATNSSHHSQKYSEQLFMFWKTVYNADKPMSQSWGLIYWVLTKQTHIFLFLTTSTEKVKPIFKILESLSPCWSFKSTDSSYILSDW